MIEYICHIHLFININVIIIEYNVWATFINILLTRPTLWKIQYTTKRGRQESGEHTRRKIINRQSCTHQNGVSFLLKMTSHLTFTQKYTLWSVPLRLTFLILQQQNHFQQYYTKIYFKSHSHQCHSTSLFFFFRDGLPLTSADL